MHQLKEDFIMQEASRRLYNSDKENILPTDLFLHMCTKVGKGYRNSLPGFSKDINKFSSKALSLATK